MIKVAVVGTNGLAQVSIHENLYRDTQRFLVFRLPRYRSSGLTIAVYRK